MDLSDDVKFVKGVGPNRVKLLNKLNIYNLEDLITYYPRDYEDRSKPKKIADTVDGEEVLIEAIVTSKMREIRTYKKNMTIYKLIVRDETDSCELVWYNQSYLKNMFKKNINIITLIKYEVIKYENWCTEHNRSRN